MTKKRERDQRDDNAPVVIDDDATERHLLKSRELLRQARSRLSSREGSAVESGRDEEPSGDGGEGSDE